MPQQSHLQNGDVPPVDLLKAPLARDGRSLTGLQCLGIVQGKQGHIFYYQIATQSPAHPLMEDSAELQNPSVTLMAGKHTVRVPHPRMDAHT